MSKWFDYLDSKYTYALTKPLEKDKEYIATINKTDNMPASVFLDDSIIGETDDNNLIFISPSSGYSTISFVSEAEMDIEWVQLKEGNMATDWTPAPEDMLGKADFQVFKTTYEANDKTIKARLLAVDSGKEGSIAYRLNETEKTASGNTTTISDIKTKPGEQITGYQTIKERSELYERVIGKDEAGIKSNMARMVMTDSLFKTEVIKNVPSAIGGRNYVLKSNNYYYTNNYKVAEYDLSTIPKGTKIKISIWGGIGSTVRTFGVYVNNSSGTASGNSQIIELKKLDGVFGQGVSVPLAKWTAEVTLNVDAKKILVFGLDNNNSSPKRVEYVQIETGDYYTDWTAAPEDKANVSSITQLENSISLKVSNADLLNQINVQAGGVLITSGTNKLNVTPTTTYIENGTIKSAMIESLEADKITTGTFDASKAKIINIDAESITSNKTSFVQSAWNGINNTVSINASGIRSANSNGDWTLYHSGAVSFGGGSSQGIYLEYAYGTRNGLAINNRGALNTEITLDLMSSARNTMNFGRRTDTNGYDFRIDHYQGSRVSFDGRGVQRYTFNVNSDAQSHAISILGHGATSGYNDGSSLSIGMETADGRAKGSRFYFSSNSDLVWLSKDTFNDLKPLAVFDLQFRWGESGRKSMKEVLERLSKAAGVNINNIPDV